MLIRSLRHGMPVTLAFLAATLCFGETPKAAITLEPQDAHEVAALAQVKGEIAFAGVPANYYVFRSAGAGEVADVERLTLHFNTATKLTKIESTKDFKLEGGSCVAGNAYDAGGSCMLLVRFTPQGAGQRLGHVMISHTGSPEPLAFGLGGYGYAPIASFTPAIITTVTGTYPSNTGLLSGAQNLTVDGGDTLYVADTGNNTIRYMDSSGVIKTLATTSAGPSGIAVDTFGEVYFDLPTATAGTMFEIYGYGPVVQINGTGTASCPAATPCNLSSEALGTPGEMSMDPYNHLFFVDSHMGAAMATVQPLPAKLIFLYDPFPYQTNPSSAMAVDASDNLYSLWSNGGTCSIQQSSLYNAENFNVIFNKIAGGHTCGFSGDGGLAGNAEIGATVGQMTFDLAGNLYFSDTVNNRVRRIDYVTGIISTIAGSGVAGYAGDNGQATTAYLSKPTGVAVDSQGQVYIISATSAAATTQVVRKLGPNGLLAFGNQLRSTASSTRFVTLSNTGNSGLTFTKVVITGSSATDFTIDANTTSCNLAVGATLASGQSCKVGIIFKPAAAGGRVANLVFLDNTVTNSNTVQLSGTGTLPAATFAITSPAASTSVTAGTAVHFAVSVTSGTTPAPTGTVKFTLDGTAIGSPVTIAAGAAAVNVASTVVGVHTLAATYSGDANYAASGAISRTFTVTAAAAKLPATVKLSVSANPSISCRSVVFSAAVAGTTGAAPTGTIVLKDGTRVLATASLNNGAAILPASLLSIGSHMVTATYGGDAVHASSTSTAVKEVVTPSMQCSSLRPEPIRRVGRFAPLE